LAVPLKIRLFTVLATAGPSTVIVAPTFEKFTTGVAPISGLLCSSLIVTAFVPVGVTSTVSSPAVARNVALAAPAFAFSVSISVKFTGPKPVS
jgi:hypothetical protein